jgi:hypothetical protein
VHADEKLSAFMELKARFVAERESMAPANRKPSKTAKRVRFLFIDDSYGRGGGVGRDLGDGASLGVGVGLGVDVGVGVGVGATKAYTLLSPAT